MGNRARGLGNFPLVSPGDNVGEIIAELVSAQGGVDTGDVFVVAQKVVSKAEGRLVPLSDVVPSSLAEGIARRTGRDPRLCQLYIDESDRIVGLNGRHVITVHRLGFEGTGAGVDLSNSDPSGEVACLLPLDPDRSAAEIRSTIRAKTGAITAVIVSDSMGDRNREGAVGKAIGLAGIRHLEEPDETDLFGKNSRPVINRVDEIAAAGSILMGQGAARMPVVQLRGVPFTPDDSASIRGLLVVSNLPSCQPARRPIEEAGPTKTACRL